MKNYGLNLEREKAEIHPDDWEFGATSPACMAEGMPSTLRKNFLPKGEIQRGVEDMMDCASRGPNNIYETKFSWLWDQGKFSPENRKWLLDNGYITGNETIEFSDAFVAINSKTTRQGNSLKAPLQAIHELGLIPKARLPLLPTMTFDEYHNPARITPELKALGAEFAKRFILNYERVYAANFTEILDHDFLDVAGYAWPTPIRGEYPASMNPFNHCFAMFNNPAYNIFDNYIDAVDGDFIKKLAHNYNFLEYGYRAIISAEKILTPEEVKKSKLQSIIDSLVAYIKTLWPSFAT